MICFAEPVLTEDLYIAHKDEFSVTCYMCDTYTSQRRSILIRDKPSSHERGSYVKDYDRKVSVAKKISGRESQGAWRQDEMIGGKSPVVK
jgi:hypothetical protein